MKKEFSQLALELCWEIEKLPAGEQQTKVSVLASDLYSLLDQFTPGIDLIAAERRRQIEEEGWSEVHDDMHDSGELARAAACYANPAYMREFSSASWNGNGAPRGWPWNAEYWKPIPNNRIRELVKAGALIAAEIARLQRLQRQAK